MTDRGELLRQATEHRLTLLRNGYIPLANKDKRCMLKGWQKNRITEETITKQWSRSRGLVTTGIRFMRGLGALDFDIRDAEVMAEMSRRVSAAFPHVFDDPDVPLLRRIGQPPKEMWLFRSLLHFSKLHSAVYVPPGTDMRDREAVKKVACSVEIFGGSSGQLGAMGPHSFNGDDSVRYMYRWPDDSPLDVRPGQLGALALKDCHAIIEIFEALMVERGWVPDIGSPKTQRRTSERIIHVFDLTEEMDLDGWRLSDLEAMGRAGDLGSLVVANDGRVGSNGKRLAISPVPWLRPVSDSGSGCLVGWTGNTVAIHDCMTNITHLPEALKPPEKPDLTDMLKEINALLRERRG